MSDVVVGILTQEIIGVIEQPPPVVVGIVSQGLTINVYSGGGELAAKVAVGSVGGHRAVIAAGALGVSHADSSDLNDIAAVIGVSTNSASDGGAVTVRLRGEMTEGSWNWTPGEFVYFDNSGVLTQTVPTSGFSLSVGTALSPTVLNVKIGVPIQLT